jgi:23S rRNA-/tRNA-specific pseudouridylate synthase
MAHRLQFEDLILFQDDDYIVVNKPPFLSTLEDRQENVNLLSLAKGYTANAQVCHRLDKETSGALAIAKHPVISIRETTGGQDISCRGGRDTQLHGRIG